MSRFDHASGSPHGPGVDQPRPPGRKIGLHRADEKIANVDGADWIRHRLEDARLNLDAIGLDFYHLAEHVHTARCELFGQSSESGQTWAGDLLHTVKHAGYDPFWLRLSDCSPRKRQALDALMQYVARRRDMIAYPDFTARGWQIGSGPTEAACKTVPARLKRSDMRWDPDNAQALAAVTTLEHSGHWSILLAMPIQKRLLNPARKLGSPPALLCDSS